VQYDPGSRDLLCPCHGATFDPANHGAVVSGPTNQPLVSVPLHIDSGGNIFVND
jgi:thiosulfate dehydrogenase (quinone) large subunit